MVKNTFIAAGTLILSALMPGLAQETTFETSTSAQNIVNRASAASYYQGKDGRASVHMIITDSQGRERTRDFVILRTDVDNIDNGDQRFYVLFNRPADVSKTAFLVWKYPVTNDDRWLYLPALDLVKRIAPSDQRTSFVGSHFFYEDVSGRDPQDDNHVLIEETDTYFVIQSTPKESGSAEFSSYINWIHKTTFIPVKTEYTDAAGEVYRTYTALAVETIDNHPTVTRSQMSDLRTGAETRMEYSSVKYDMDLPEEIFTERYLRNPPRQFIRQ